MRKIFKLFIGSICLMTLCGCNSSANYQVVDVNQQYVAETQVFEEKEKLPMDSFLLKNDLDIISIESEIGNNKNYEFITENIDEMSPSGLISNLNQKGYKLVSIGTPNLVKTFSNSRLDKDTGYTFEDVQSLNYSITSNEYKLRLNFAKEDISNIDITVLYVYKVKNSRVVLPGNLAITKDWLSCKIDIYD